MRRAIPDDLEASRATNIAFHQTVIEAIHNFVLQTMVGTIEAIVTASFRLTTSLMNNDANTLGVCQRLLVAIRVYDTVDARATTSDLLDVAVKDYRRGH